MWSRQRPRRKMFEAFDRPCRPGLKSGAAATKSAGADYPNEPAKAGFVTAAPHFNGVRTTAINYQTMRFFTVSVTLFALSTAALAGPDSKLPGDWHAHGVFLSQQRIATLQRRVQRKVEPTYAAYLKLQKSAAAALERVPHAPETWYVP